ncbi:MAG: alpha/beta fold hydrolase [Flavobacteriales bacterium]|nr:alpha/beta fold hydrolase [Flavobacteriales bacterium]
MKLIETLIEIYIKLIALFSNQKAADVTFLLFQKTQPRKMSADEIKFYSETEHYTIESDIEPIEVYTKGPKDGELFILLHGWNSNLARLSHIVDVLVRQGYRCVLFDMPGHGKSILKHTNLKKNSLVFEAVLNHLNPQQTFNVLTHSFGSIIASLTLANTHYQLNHLIYMTSLDRIEPIFEELKRRLKLKDAVYSKIVSKADSLLQEPLKGIAVVNKTEAVNYQYLSLFHDKHDKILDFKNSELLNESLNNSTLYAYENIGHSRMLSNAELLKDLEELIKEKAPVELV